MILFILAKLTKKTGVIGCNSTSDRLRTSPVPTLRTRSSPGPSTSIVAMAMVLRFVDSIPTMSARGAVRSAPGS